MNTINKLAAIGLIAAVISFVPQNANAACATMKHFNKPVTISFLGFGIPAGTMTFTTAACWTTLSINRASPQLVNGHWMVIDSAHGNAIFAPGRLVSYGAYTTNSYRTSATSWGSVRYSIRAGATHEGVSLPAGQFVDVQVSSQVFAQGFCLDAVAGVLVSQKMCSSSM